MSEFNPFAAAAEAPEYIPEETTDSAEGSKKNVVALGALAAVALGAGAFFFLSGGGGEDQVESFVPLATAPKAAGPVAAPAPAAKLPVASAVNLGRNPFRALYVKPAPAPPAPPAPPPAPPAAAPAQVVVVTQPAPPPPPAQSTVALKSVAAGPNGSNPTGTFVYDGKTVTGAPGDVMAGKLLVISIQQDGTGDWFAKLKLGDGEPFEVHQRQVVVVM